MALQEARNPAAPELHRMFGLRQRRPRAVAATEFGAALAALGIKHRSVARWFRTSERNIRRWKSGTRKTPTGVAVVVRLMMAQKVTVADVELAAAPVYARNSARRSARPAPAVEAIEPEPLAEPAPAGSGQTIGEKVLALASGTCRWPIGDPGHPSFCFCSAPATEPPYCERHRALAYLPSKAVSPHRFGLRPNASSAGSLAPSAGAHEYPFGHRLLRSSVIKAPRQDRARTLAPAGAD